MKYNDECNNDSPLLAHTDGITVFQTHSQMRQKIVSSSFSSKFRFDERPLALSNDSWHNNQPQISSRSGSVSKLLRFTACLVSKAFEPAPNYRLTYSKEMNVANNDAEFAESRNPQGNDCLGIVAAVEAWKELGRRVGAERSDWLHYMRTRDSCGAVGNCSAGGRRVRGFCVGEAIWRRLSAVHPLLVPSGQSGNAIALTTARRISLLHLSL